MGCVVGAGLYKQVEAKKKELNYLLKQIKVQLLKVADLKKDIKELELAMLEEMK